ncbi:hypothetical protein P691DRAFT_662602 [Macrolepiota fuliginosa MF-IS2]|uniref:CCHC-type domain-containing protein n=1 Tax=Macrolepiota fuliginosa MF-IS2 TaxID=1400762 RepID=A0A9P6C818_9AGAR|nr:hypothetical protein P691DRAFT_662602 [Macrolepiota fuliginosa MF-IS2]
MEDSTSTPPNRISTNKSQNESVSSSRPNGNANSSDLFFEDVTPAPLPSAIGNLPPPTYTITASSSKDADEAKLLLPAHVSVLGSTPVEILPPTESDEEGDTDYIKYLDYGGDHQREFLRYFEEPEDESTKLKRTVCKNCGAEGDHKTAECRVLICLTCGVRDEHVTKSCPVSKVCFTCGMKGHINSNCPNRHLARSRDHNNSGRCKRCFSGFHQTSECPTWWRLYIYVTEEERGQILDDRRSKRDLELGKGGEGYIAEDEWCYNCGEPGHWGDDCQGSKRYDKPDEPSAFGLYNISTGPFYDPNESGAPARQERRLRDWEQEDDWGKHAPDQVGRQGRRKMMEKMRRNAQRFEEVSDPDDWFGNARNVRNRGFGDSKVKISFSKSIGQGRQFLPPDLPTRPPPQSKPSLLSRLSDKPPDDLTPWPHRNGNGGSGGSKDGSLSIKGAASQRQRRDDNRKNSRSAPQYRGGYAR